ncbi:MAG: hypothetical protein NVS3B2_11750 [Ramlibacter sp.]
MHVRKTRLMLAFNLALAATAIIAIAAVAIRQIVPTIATRDLLLYCAGGGIARFAVVILAEPRGLAALRRAQDVDGRRQA